MLKEIAKEILSDDLYLGYYFQLIQDALYWKFLYYDHGYQVTCPKDAEVLYHDYMVLNFYLVSKFELDYALTAPERFETEKINSIYPFSLTEFILSIQRDLTPSADPSPIFFPNPWLIPI
ncbi:MAG: hypothetical protein E7256_02550 [Lachnospiraceae bacterium]|nr:hypothetical protein [Lachnospiraceae bacterium]